MEFNFDIKQYFKDSVTKIGPSIVPDSYHGDRRDVQECISRISHIITVLGENSAKAQGLQKVITSGERLKNSDHIVYVLTDPNGGARGNGVVLGMLKVGVKHLYLFDGNGDNHEVYANCVLDFYVHESKQRMGLGKKLFEHMLQVEKVQPRHMAIDKPSPKFLSFLHKHYGLQTIIPQMNNFALFDGFFVDRPAEERRDKVIAAGICSSATRFTSSAVGALNGSGPLHQQQLVPSPPSTPNVASSTAYGRPAAHRPISTMGMILQHHPPSQGPSGACSEVDTSSQVGQEEETPPLEPEVEEIPDVKEEEVVEAPVDIEPETEHDASAPPVAEIEETPALDIAPEPLPCKLQAGTVPHLDLKFYHSSLW